MPLSCQTDAKRSRSGRPNLGFVLAFCVAVAALLGIWQTPQRINHDSAYYLQQAEMVLDGAVPYRDFVDVNLPLINYLNLPPVWLARTLNVSPIVALQAYVMLLLLISALEIGFLVQHRRWGLRPAEQGMVVLAWMALYLLVDWRGDVGQREHLFVLLYVPYLFLRILRHRRGSVAAWFAVLLGIQAGLGASIKPHFLVAAGVVEIALLAASRRWRALVQPETVSLAGVVAAYVAYWMFMPRQMREEFLGRWAPLLRRSYFAYYVSYRETAEGILLSPFSAAACVGVLAAALLLYFHRRAGKGDSPIFVDTKIGTIPRAAGRFRLRLHLVALAAFGAMALAMVLFQQKGWTYHRIPLDCAGLLCLTIIALSGRRRGTVTSGATIPVCATTTGADIPVCVATSGADIPVCPENRDKRCRQERFPHRGLAVVAVAVVLTIWFAGRPESARPEPSQYLALRHILEQRTQPGDRVLFVVTSVRPAYPMLTQMDRRPCGRYLTCFPIGLLYAGAQSTADAPPYRRYEDAPPEERLFLDELREDVLRFRPRLIVFHDSPGWLALPEGFSIFEYLRYSGWTDRALASYREIPCPKGWRAFELKPTNL
jgi:hypothetical protein